MKQSRVTRFFLKQLEREKDKGNKKKGEGSEQVKGGRGKGDVGGGG